MKDETSELLVYDMNSPYGNGPTWAAARLTLFNSIYR
jgi:hypothetical protein